MNRKYLTLISFACLSVILFTGGCLPHPQADTPKADIPWADTPWADTAQGRHPPGQTPSLGRADTPLGRHPPRADTPWADTPLGRHPLSSACWDTHTPTQCMLGYGQQAGGTHPTGMHFCFLNLSQNTLNQSTQTWPNELMSTRTYFITLCSVTSSSVKMGIFYHLRGSEYTFKYTLFMIFSTAVYLFL